VIVQRQVQFLFHTYLEYLFNIVPLEVQEALATYIRENNARNTANELRHSQVVLQLGSVVSLCAPTSILITAAQILLVCTDRELSKGQISNPSSAHEPFSASKEALGKAHLSPEEAHYVIHLRNGIAHAQSLRSFLHGVINCKKLIKHFPALKGDYPLPCRVLTNYHKLIKAFNIKYNDSRFSTWWESDIYNKGDYPVVMQ
jgi:hypothetical protein